MNKRTLVPAAAALLLLAGQAMAGITYSFSTLDPVYGTGQHRSFTLVTDHLIDQDASFGVDSLLACNSPGGECLGVRFYADARAAQLTSRTGLAAVAFEYQVGNGTALLNYYFEQDALGFGGNTTLLANRAHMFVSGQPAPATPPAATQPAHMPPGELEVPILIATLPDVQPAAVTLAEPASLACLAGGIGLLGAMRRRRATS